jgi:hypothetical protein
VYKKLSGTKDTVRSGDYICFYGRGNKNHQLGTGFFVDYRIISAVKSIEFVSNSMLFIVLGGHWCNIIVLNVHAPSEEKNYYVKGSCYEELELVFDHFTKYHMQILLGDFNAKLGIENFQTDNWECKSISGW